MDLKDLWKGLKKGGGGERPLEVDELILMGRLEEAEAKLDERLRDQPGDSRAKRKLADIYMQTFRKEEGLKLFEQVADQYYREGFHDKAMAVLSRVLRILPDDTRLLSRVQTLERAKRLEHKRSVVTTAFLHAVEGSGSGLAAFEIERLWVNLIRSSLMEDLDHEQLRRVFGAFKAVRLNEGDIVAKAGERLEALFLIAEGGLEAEVEGAGGQRTSLRSFEAGQIVGDRALLEHQPWPATYKANTKRATLLKLDQEDLERVLQGNPDPQALLRALREERNDHEIAEAVSRMKGQ